MRTRRLLPTLLATSLAVGALAFAPGATGDTALETTETGTGDATTTEEPELHGPCEDRADGVTVLTPESFFDQVVPTPIGAAGSTQADAAVLQVSLEGHPVGTTADLALTLDWDTPEVGDYDLVTNGNNTLDTAQPERRTIAVFHCAVVDVDTEVFIGTPLDTVTLQADVVLAD